MDKSVRSECVMTDNDDECIHVCICPEMMEWICAPIVNALVKQCQQKGVRVAVVINELGETLYGAEMEANEEKEQTNEWVELGGGCACCTVKSALLIQLEKLLEKRKFDHLVLETSGVADPFPLVKALWTDDALDAKAGIDAVVVTIDALAHATRNTGAAGVLRMERDVEMQIAFADLVLVTKLDAMRTRGEGVAEKAADAMRAAVRSVNPTTEIVMVEHKGDISLDVVLQRGGMGDAGRNALRALGGFSLAAAVNRGRHTVMTMANGGIATAISSVSFEVDKKDTQGVIYQPIMSCDLELHDCITMTIYARTHMYMCVCVYVHVVLLVCFVWSCERTKHAPAGVCAAAVETFIESFLWRSLDERGGNVGGNDDDDDDTSDGDEDEDIPILCSLSEDEEILRMKAVFALGEDKYVLQAVREVYELRKTAFKDDDLRINRVVIIGRNLRRADEYKRLFLQSILASSHPPL